MKLHKGFASIFVWSMLCLILVGRAACGFRSGCHHLKSLDYLGR